MNDAERLCQATYDVKAPLILTFNGDGGDNDANDGLYCHTIIHVVPGRRLTACATWRSKEVVVKFFFHRYKARIHFKKELRGHEVLVRASIATPALFFAGKIKNSSMSGIFAMVFERLEPILSVEKVLKKNGNDGLPLLESMIILVANMHAKGVSHQDLHLDNFLVTSSRLYLLDSAAVRSMGSWWSWPKRRRVKNFALLLTNIPGNNLQLHRYVYEYYLKLIPFSGFSWRFVDYYRRNMKKK